METQPNQLSLEDAQERLLQAVTPLPAESVDLLASLGRYTAAPIRARRTLPPFANSAMDGYALRHADTANAPVVLPVTHTVPAGARAPQAVAPGTACRIYTGAPLPPGADTVVMQENVQREGNCITVQAPSELGQHVRAAGEDMQPGTELLPAQSRITAGDIGALAAQGICWVTVHRAPRVAIISTGDELVEIDVPINTPDHGHAIANSNAMMLHAQVSEAGGIPWRLPPVADAPEALAEALEAAARVADVVLTSGGVSVGDADHLRPVMEKLGTLNFWRVAIKPGKPLAFGHVHGKPLVGLPGNPASSFVCFELFARPALRRMLGDPTPLRPRRRAWLNTALPARGPRRELIRASLHREEHGWSVTPLQKQGSGQLSSLLQADALIDCPAHLAAQAVGAPVDVWVLGKGP